MVAYNKFNAFVANIANGLLNLASDTPKIMLTNTLPVATNSVYTDISTNELANGNGYTTGGATVTVTSSTQTSGVLNWIIQSVTFTATGSMGPFRYVVLYDSSASTKTLIGWWDYGSSLTLTSGQSFTVTFSGSVLTIT